jgi:hypothetical protein
MKKFSIILPFIITMGIISPQILHVPAEFSRAIAKGTRTETGLPGEHYWQNKAVYEINAELVPESRELIGSETITYFNNSPDTLRELVVRLYQDIYKRNAVRDFEADPRDVTDGVQLKSIFVDGKEYKTTDTARFSQYGTNVTLTLLSPLKPRTSIKVAIDWAETISRYRNIRTGCYDSTTFFVGYWYPQIAVYDDIHGWDRINYSGQVEFYNDCNDFDVKILVPKEYIVWATGLQKNRELIFNATTMAQLTEADQSSTAQRIAVPGGYTKLFHADTPHTFHYSASDVPDFAFAASNKLFWDARSVVVDSTTNRRALVQTIYPVENDEMKILANTAASILETYSFKYPRIPYPYPAMTVFVNTSPRGGMEFPMMVNDGMPTTHAGTVGLTGHEIAHTYFPFYMGINERRFAWMDEGWATNLPFDLNPATDKSLSAREANAITYSDVAGTSADLPLMIESFQSNGTAYRNASYGKPGCMYDILSDIVGKENFIRAIAYYVTAWHQKHPQPQDFFHCFNAALGKNYDWFWHPWFDRFAYPDLSIDAVSIASGSAHITIRNKGGIPLPVEITVLYADGTSDIKHYTAAVWEFNDTQTFDVPVKTDKQVTIINLGNKAIPDSHHQDNIWTVK